MSDVIEWDGGKIEQGRAVEGTPYIIGAFKTGLLDKKYSCEVCGEGLENISMKFVRIGSGELVIGGIEVSGWLWCPVCREKRRDK